MFVALDDGSGVSGDLPLFVVFSVSRALFLAQVLADIGESLLIAQKSYLCQLRKVVSGVCASCYYLGVSFVAFSVLQLYSIPLTPD